MTMTLGQTINDHAGLDITKAEAIYFNFGNGYGEEIRVDAPISVREADDGTLYVQSSDGYVTMVAPGWLSADIIPVPGQSVLP